MPRHSVPDADEVPDFTTLDPVRRRPQMYVGSLDAAGLFHVFCGVVDNAIDEAWAGHCTLIAVTLAADGRTLTVEDDGRGIPVGPDPQALEALLTRVRISRPRRFPGLSVAEANGLSERFAVRVRREGRVFEQEFARGEPVQPLADVGATDRHGTRIALSPDRLIFPEGVTFDERMLRSYLRDAAFTSAGLETAFHDERSGRQESYRYPNGLADLVECLTEFHTGHRPAPPFRCSGTARGVLVEVALQYVDHGEALINFVNGQRLPAGGKFVAALKRAVAEEVSRAGEGAAGRRHWQEVWPHITDGQMGFTWQDVRHGLVAAVSVRLPHPDFEGCTAPNRQLLSPEAAEAVVGVLGPQFRGYLKDNREIAERISRRAFHSWHTRMRAEAEGE